MKKITVHVSEGQRVKEQGNLFGIFFEDLNHAADGGLYGEMVRIGRSSSIRWTTEVIII